MMATEANYVIYTDGSAVNGKKNIAGGFSAIIVKDNKVKKIFKGSEAGANSMQSELLAVILGLYEFTEHFPHQNHLVIRTDSKIIADCFLQGWYKTWIEKKWMTTKNKTYWQLILNIMMVCNLQVKFEWVRGHNGNHFNEMADRVALKARKTKEAQMQLI